MATKKFINSTYTSDRMYSGRGGYHSHRGAEMNVPRGYNLNRGRVGVELEFECTDGTTYNNWCEDGNIFSNWFFCERDGSLGSMGIELITIPLRPKDATSPKHWEPLLSYLRETGCNSWNTAGRCGLHVHVGNELLGSNAQMVKDTQAKLIYLFEHILRDTNLLQGVYGRSRSYNEYRASTRSSSSFEHNVGYRMEVIKKRAKQNELTRDIIAGNDSIRYHAINITNRATTEFRLGRGSLRIERVVAIIEFSLLCVKYARYTGFGDLGYTDLIKYLSIYASPNLRTFLEAHTLCELFPI